MNNIILFLIVVTSFIEPFMISSLNIAIIEIEKSLHTTSISTSWIISSFILAIAVSLLPSGKLAEIYGKKKIFTLGILIFSIGSLLCAFSHNAVEMILFRIIQGVGCGMFFSTGTAILAHVFPKKRRGQVLGINVSSVYLGLSLGPFIGALITEKYSWHAIFIITAMAGFLMFLLSFYFLKFDDIKNNHKLDPWQTLVYAFFIISFVYGFSKLNTLDGVYILMVALIFGALLIYLDQKSKHAMMGLKKFAGNIVFIFSNLASLINYTATAAITFFLSIYLQTVKHLDIKTAGSFLLIQPIVMTGVSVFAGRLSDKTEPQWIASLGMFFATLSLLMISFLSFNSSLFYMVMILIVAGIGFGLFSSPNTNAIMSSVERKDYAQSSALLSTSRVMGQSVSMGISTLVLSIFMAGQPLNENSNVFLKAMKTGFLFFTLFSVVGIYFSLKRGKIHIKIDKNQ